MAERIRLHFPKQNLSQVDIYLDNLRNNYRLIKKFAVDKPLMAVVKGDAYGHGLVECATALVDEGAAHLGVQDVTEGVALRDAGLGDPEIYVMSGLDFPSQITLASERDLTIVVYSREQLVTVMNMAQVRGFRIKVFLKVDTGMGRLGMPAHDIAPFLQQARDSSYLQVKGVCTHLATVHDEAAVAQLKLFQNVIRKAEEIFTQPIYFSALSGGALLAHPEYPDGMPRVGLALYGVAPPQEALAAPVPFPVQREPQIAISPPLFRQPEPRKPHVPPSAALVPKLKPVMRVSSTVIQVKRLRKNDTVSYDRTFQAPYDMLVAVVPFGYVNGLNTSRSGHLNALIRGQLAMQVGKICMNLSVFNVNEIPGIKPGDEVVFLGDQAGATLDAYQEFAWGRSNPYEILCLLGRLNNRIYHREKSVA
jgi:alanine racemase